MSELIFRGGTVLTMDDDFSVRRGDVAVREGRIVSVGPEYTPQTRDYRIVDASGCIVCPGLVQSHVHTCQTLARGRADNLELLDWLHQVVWPYEGALTRAELLASARLAYLELLMGGTTAVLDMATVHHTDAVFEAAQSLGVRATIGKAMMDADDEAIPAGLRESTQESIDQSNELCAEWHGRANGRLRYAYTPRFALSCTEDLLRETARLSRDRNITLHTHTSENRSEIAEVKRRTGMDNLHYLHSLGMTGPHVCLAHCVWISSEEMDILASTQTNVLHCPSSNTKLASGFAPIPELLGRGIRVSIGADGCPCNNTLDGFREMRLAALIHKPSAGPKAMSASTVLRLATRGGARALGIEEEVGSLEVGKRADIIAVDVTGPHCIPSHDPYSTLVYAARASDVRHVAVDGRLLLDNREVLSCDRDEVCRSAESAARAVFGRM